MMRKVRTLSLTAGLADAMATMTKFNIRHLVVECEGNVVGVISQRDIFKHIIHCLNIGKRPANAPITELMVVDPITVSPDTPLGEAARVMASEKIGCLPVVSGDKHLVGIVTVVDLLQHMADQIRNAMDRFTLEIDQEEEVSPKGQAVLNIVNELKALLACKDDTRQSEQQEMQQS